MKLLILTLLTMCLTLSAEKHPENKAPVAESAEKIAVMTDEVKEIIKKSKKAIKVEKAAAFKSMEQKGTMVIANMNMKGIISLKQTQKCIKINSEFEGMKETKAYNGKTAWSNSLVTGFREIKGAEKLVLIADTLQYSFHQEKFYDEIKLAGKEKFDGKLCYKIELIKKGMDSRFEFIDTETFLTAGYNATVVTPQGKLQTTLIINNWVEHEKGFKYSKQMTQSVGPVKILINVNKVTVNPEFDDKIFDPPAN